MDLSSSTLQMDAYSIRARLWPALLTALPLGLLTYAVLPGDLFDEAALGGLFAWCGGAYLLAQIARDAGKRKEEALFKSWGGAPTTRHLRHRRANDKLLLRRRHRQISALTGEALPSAEREQADPEEADAMYRRCTLALRERTRNRQEFPLVFAESCAYGFRRNLLGLRPIGIGVSALTLAMVAWLTHPAVPPTFRAGPLTLWVAGVVSALLLIAFLFVITPAWVHIKAEAYAGRLLGACEKLVDDESLRLARTTEPPPC